MSDTSKLLLSKSGIWTENKSVCFFYKALVRTRFRRLCRKKLTLPSIHVINHSSRFPISCQSWYFHKAPNCRFTRCGSEAGRFSDETMAVVAAKKNQVESSHVQVEDVGPAVSHFRTYVRTTNDVLLPAGGSMLRSMSSRPLIVNRLIPAISL